MVPSAKTDVVEASSTLLSSVTGNSNLVGATWMISSALLTTYSTTKYLKYEPSVGVSSTRKSVLRLSRPTLLTLSRFGGSLFLGLLAHPDLGVSTRVREVLQSLSDFALPAVFLFVANFCNSISLDRIGISLTYTSKCAIPLMTVLLTLLLDGSKALPDTYALLSLLPIALGIAAASWNSPTFEAFGFAAAMVSCISQSALNVSSKRAMTKTGLSGPKAQRCMVAVGLLFAIVYSGFQTVAAAAQQPDSEALGQRPQPPPTWLASLAVLAYHIEYVLSFMFVGLVEPITYGACDAVRRLSIILSGRWMFGGEPFTKLNISGIGLALLGALSYSVASSTAS